MKRRGEDSELGGYVVWDLELISLTAYVETGRTVFYLEMGGQGPWSLSDQALGFLAPDKRQWKTRAKWALVHLSEHRTGKR